ncbi:MAG: sodium-independent anion transporter, partial [Rubrobacteraceae bacterium]
LMGGYRSRGIELVFTHMKLPVRQRLEKAGWNEKFGRKYHYQTTREALRAVGLMKSRAERGPKTGPWKTPATEQSG